MKRSSRLSNILLILPIMLIFLFSAATDIIANAHNHKKSTDKDFSYMKLPHFGVKFLYPNKWEMKVMDTFDNGDAKEIWFRPIEWLQLMEQSEFEMEPYPLSIRFYYASFDKGAEEEGFEFDEELKCWKYPWGRSSMGGPAEVLKGENWSGLLGKGAAGWYLKGNGGYAGAGNELEYAYLHDETNRAIYIQYFPVQNDENYAILSTIIESLKFTKPAKSK